MRLFSFPLNILQLDQRLCNGDQFRCFLVVHQKQARSPFLLLRLLYFLICVSIYCKAEDKKLLERIERQISINGALTEEMNQRFLFAKVANKFCWEALDDFNSGRINSLPNLGQYD